MVVKRSGTTVAQGLIYMGCGLAGGVGIMACIAYTLVARRRHTKRAQDESKAQSGNQHAADAGTGGVTSSSHKLTRERSARLNRVQPEVVPPRGDPQHSISGTANRLIVACSGFVRC